MTAWYDDSGPPPDEPGAPVLVLLHAFPLSSTMWHRVRPLLVPHARVVAVDLPGLGRTGHPDVPTDETGLRRPRDRTRAHPRPPDQASTEPPTEPSMERLAGAVLEVLDELGVGTATVWGLSTGGYAALELARTAPGRLDALVLSSTTPWLGAPDPPDERREVADGLERRDDTEPVADSVTGGLGTTAQREQPDLVEAVAGLIADADPQGVAWTARAIAARHDTSAALASYPGPTLLLFGDEDTEVPSGTVDRMRALRGERPTRVEVLAGTGHLLALERPARAAAPVLALLQEVRRPHGGRGDRRGE